MCLEHLQVSTAYRDTYEPYFTKGQKTIKLKFTELKDVIDIHKNGLRFFTYCANPFTLLQSSVQTAFMWFGGNGLSKYIPIASYQPTLY
jgi:hypothetical protein